MANEIKIRLLALGKKQIDLLAELRKRGFPRVDQPALSRCINGVDTNPQALLMKKRFPTKFSTSGKTNPHKGELTMTEESAKILLLGEFEKYFNRYSSIELNNRDKVAYIERLTRLYNCVKNDKPIEGMAATDEIIAQMLRKTEKTADDNKLQLEFCKMKLTAIRRIALLLFGLQIFTILALIFK